MIGLFSVLKYSGIKRMEPLVILKKPVLFNKNELMMNVALGLNKTIVMAIPR